MLFQNAMVSSAFTNIFFFVCEPQYAATGNTMISTYHAWHLFNVKKENEALDSNCRAAMHVQHNKTNENEFRNAVG